MIEIIKSNMLLDVISELSIENLQIDLKRVQFIN